MASWDSGMEIKDGNSCSPMEPLSTLFQAREESITSLDSNVSYLDYARAKCFEHSITLTC